MSGEAFWFGALPNALLIAFAAAVLYRLAVRPVPVSEPLERDSTRAAGYGRIPLQWGLVVVLTGHLIALLFPRTLQAWNGAPIRLYLLEATGLAFGLWAITGLAFLWARWLRDGKNRTELGIADVVVVWALVIVVITGVLTAVLQRFGAAWGTATVVPWFRSVFTTSPRTELVADLPWIAQVHAVSAFALAAAFPLSRWVTIVALPVRYLRRWWGELIKRSPDAAQGATTWVGGYGRGAVIVFLLIVILVWLPSRIVSQLASSSSWVQDTLGAGVFAAGLVGALFGLRWAQKTGRI